MIRLTLLLLAGIGGVMLIAGEEIDRPEGSDQPVEVARAATEDTGLLRAEAATADASTAPAEATPARLPLEDEAGAIQRALAATEQPVQQPMAPRPTLVVKPVLVAGMAPSQSLIDAATPAAPAAADETSAPGWVVTGSRVNLRAGPSTGFAVIGQASQGDRAEVLEDPGNGWLRIRSTGIDDAWIYGRFLEQAG